ncbi:MAG: hypothetical protein GWM92_20790 [Gemmatimonadetes bacterium]|nr:hypothetical protein [Gemmatimonadota bacterium]NIR81288.1 hypothetical protein [Gemmatimonadota bacterium]NIT90123.1 hypothetical protein [Gemmatimonadota bacterium]NIU33950.1 hypothetical protein [Gemmatimonadota bacterium]NIU38129.1 hypothetical protein [Gemmatimonadota bacterium]
MSAGDWRLTGQERYLRGVPLERLRFSRAEPERDHDHCEFCWAKFGRGGRGEKTLDIGYTTLDRAHWICPRCFEDFRHRFGWTTK